VHIQWSFSQMWTWFYVWSCVTASVWKKKEEWRIECDECIWTLKLWSVEVRVRSCKINESVCVRSQITWQHGDGDISPLETGDSGSGDRFRVGPHPYHRQRPWLVRQSNVWSLNTILRATSTPGCKQHLSGKTGLPPQGPRHFAWKLSARVSQNVQPYYLSYMFAAATSTDEY